ncbi:hypothetical protein FN846DRAFT_779834 [Sphaerosporella brunnea]|uniref:P-type Na(+) transporter n=1 Tax=Sphaerosporella brunnea TaxID=1250544 RepID=A0A5J5EU12_9PEZI|nr:hypothetical protein FN846DRAFT_779834 [Sphaerosporella brunnea]
MVNLTPASAASSSPATSPINHSGLVTVQASDEGCNDDPPPIPQPLAGDSRADHPRHVPAGGVSIPVDQHGDVTARPANLVDFAGEPARNGPGAGVKVYDYGAAVSPASSSDDLAGPDRGVYVDSCTTVTSPKSSFTAVGTLTEETTIEIAGDPYDGVNPHVVDADAVATTLGVDLRSGLKTADAKAKLQKDGLNKLAAGGGIAWYGVLIRQISNSLTLVLVIAMAASYGMLDFIEGSVIAAVICLNIVIGFVQDYRAEKTMQSLNSLSAPIATVIRNHGKIDKIKAEELVVGDVVKIHVGDVVPADLRIFEAMNLETNEALLTGESLPIAKHPDYVAPNADCPIGDRQNMVWSSSTVSKGRGLGVVVATGMNTEVGRIAELLRGKKEKEGGVFATFVRKCTDSVKNMLGLVGTPLQVKLSKFALLLFGIAILLAVIVFSAAKWRINDENLIYGICVAVAVIPESLIAVLTITMALGTKTMAKGNVIVRKMQALEAVGGVTNICSDKTGTLTQGKMIARKALVEGLGEITQDLLSSGDWDLLAEHPFDSTIKKMSIVHHHKGRDTVEAFMKGAGEVVVPTLALPEHKKAEIMERIENLAGQGLRVLCVAHKRIDRADAANRALVEEGMNFLGLVGLYDPPRSETKDAVRRCKIAGVEVHMLTGDHIRTATAIAHEVGILGDAMPAALASTMVMTASAFDALSDAQVDALPELPKVIARCSPATKVRMVEALHRRKAFCVMTGDGVNDSPALARADVGIAMGLSGSDVAKDAADLVLTDDNFASIVRAVEEGRRLFDNIQKFIMHLLISNISQVVLLLIGLAFQDRNGVSVFPLSPLEILWVNMITSSFLALGLGLEEAAPDVMTRPPHDLRTGVFTWEVIIDKTLYGVTMGVLCLASFIIVVYAGNGGDLGHGCNHAYNDTCGGVFRARATVFAVLSFLLLLTAWEVKHFSRSLFRMNPEEYAGPLAVFKTCYRNRFLFWAVVAGFAITWPVIYVPKFNTVVFKHMAIGWEWGVVVAACVLYLMVVEGWKAIKRWRGWGSAGYVKNGGVDVEMLTAAATVVGGNGGKA